MVEIERCAIGALLTKLRVTFDNRKELMFKLFELCVCVCVFILFVVVVVVVSLFLVGRVFQWLRIEKKKDEKVRV